MKVAQEIDVDNVTIIINPQNKLEAKIPPTSSEVEIEEVTGILNTTITSNSKEYPVTKVGRVKGTNWLVFQAEGLLQTQTTPPVTEPEKPPVATQPDVLYTDYRCPPNITPSGSGYEMDGALTIYHTLYNNSGKVPQSLVFTVNVGFQSREYTVPYPGPSVQYAWTAINDFAYEERAYLRVRNIKVVFTDGSSVTSDTISPGCFIGSVPE